MTRNKPWRGDATSTTTQSDAHVGIPTIEHNGADSRAGSAQATSLIRPTLGSTESSHSGQESEGQTSTFNHTEATTTSSPIPESNVSGSADAKEAEASSAAQLAYVAPKVADEDDEDTLHVYQPEDDDFVEAPVENPADVLPGNASTSHTATTGRRNQEYSRDTHEGFEEDEDLLTALSNLMSGAPRGHGAGPFGFLDVMASALSDALPRAFLPEEEACQPSQNRSIPVPADHERASSPARGHFHASSSGINLVQQRYLVAQCRDVRGVPRRSQLDLNDCLSNDNGHFKWSKGGNFTASARNVKLVEDGRVLKAQLKECNGRWRDATVHLPHRVTNKNGQLALLT